MGKIAVGRWDRGSCELLPWERIGQGQVSCERDSLTVWMCHNLESKYSVEITLGDLTAGFFMVFPDQAKKGKAKC